MATNRSPFVPLNFIRLISFASDTAERARLGVRTSSSRTSRLGPGGVPPGRRTGLVPAARGLSSGGVTRPDRGEAVAQRQLRILQVVRRLQPQEQSFRQPEIAREQQVRFRRHGALAEHDFVMRRGGTPIARASSDWVIRIGCRKSSSRISPGWGSGNRSSSRGPSCLSSVSDSPRSRHRPMSAGCLHAAAVVRDPDAVGAVLQREFRVQTMRSPLPWLSMVQASTGSRLPRLDTRARLCILYAYGWCGGEQAVGARRLGVEAGERQPPVDGPAVGGAMRRSEP